MPTVCQKELAVTKAPDVTSQKSDLLDLHRLRYSSMVLLHLLVMDVRGRRLRTRTFEIT
jgi:hypothetical protein